MRLCRSGLLPGPLLRCSLRRQLCCSRLLPGPLRFHLLPVWVRRQASRRFPPQVQGHVQGPRPQEVLRERLLPGSELLCSELCCSVRQRLLQLRTAEPKPTV